MAGIISGLNSALSAIGANSRFFGATSNNIANVDTSGFQAEETRFVSQELGGTRANCLVDPGTVSFLRANAPGELSDGDGAPSNVDLTTELTNLTLGSRAYEAAVKVVQTGDELLDTIIDIKS
jgi:flagellar basal-body rod protein FlgC